MFWTFLTVKWEDCTLGRCGRRGENVRLVDSGVQRRAGRHVLLLRIEQTLRVAPLRPRSRLLVVQTPEAVVVLVGVALLSAAPPPPPGPLLVLDLRAVEDVDGVGRQGELQAVEVLVHHLFAVDELGAVDLGERRRHSGSENALSWS